MKKTMSFLLIAAVIVVLFAGWLWQRPYQSNQPLLPITQQAVVQYKPVIPDKTIVVSRTDIQACVDRNLAYTNKEYLDKYQSLLGYGRPHYSLTVAECWELMLSSGDDAAVLSAWSNLYCVSLDAAVDAKGHLYVVGGG